MAASPEVSSDEARAGVLRRLDSRKECSPPESPDPARAHLGKTLLLIFYPGN